MSEELLTVTEVANILRVDTTTVRRWVKGGALEAIVLPHVQTRQAYRIKRKTIDQLLGKCDCQQPTDDDGKTGVPGNEGKQARAMWR